MYYKQQNNHDIRQIRNLIQSHVITYYSINLNTNIVK